VAEGRDAPLPDPEVGGRYPRYVLGVLVLVYVANFLDRQILSILNEQIKADLWIGIGASTVQDLVLPRMRATASAAYLLSITFVGLALGPYTVGTLSDALGLRTAMLLALLAGGVAAVLLVLAARHLPGDEASLRDRARAAGEVLS